MIIVRGSSEFASKTGISLTVGNFDGVHLGHRELLRRTVSRARDAGTTAVALTFSPHPVLFFNPGARFYEITTEAEKADLISRTGIDELVIESFDGAVGRMSPAEFAREVLSRRLRAQWITVGFDFTFGRNRTGTPAMLAEIGGRLGFAVEIVPPLLRGGAIVSSTRIRHLLLGGRVREAEELLCRPYRMSGPVVTGAGRGKKLGFPTANIRFSQELIPLPGVYVVDAEIGGLRYRAVASVGFNPTFGENSLGLEVHVIDFHRELYGETIGVLFRDRIRDERKFKSVDSLVRQIGKDVQFAREVKLPAERESSCAGRDSAAAGGALKR